jgi:hypothetical protein
MKWWVVLKTPLYEPRWWVGARQEWVVHTSRGSRSPDTANSAVLGSKVDDVERCVARLSPQPTSEPTPPTHFTAPTHPTPHSPTRDSTTESDV